MLARLPVQFYVFDLLQVGGTSPLIGTAHRAPKTVGRARPQRRRPDPHPASYTDITGPDLLAIAADNGFEGVAARRLNSLYYLGKHSQAWIKTPLRHTQEVIIGGWIEGGGRRSGTLGVHDEQGGRLRFAGRVGTGFT